MTAVALGLQREFELEFERLTNKLELVKVQNEYLQGSDILAGTINRILIIDLKMHPAPN